MKRFQRSKKSVRIKTPGGRNVTHFKKERVSYIRCNNCGAKLNTVRLDPNQLKKLPKVKRRPERPFPNLCSKCMREVFKKRVIL